VRATLALSVATLAACSSLSEYFDSAEQHVSSAAQDVESAAQHPGPVGRLMDRPPPAVTVTSGDPSGPLLAGPGLAELPDASIDLVIAPPLKEWLTFAERKNLAAASEEAATGTTGLPFAWQSEDGTHTMTAAGSAVAVADVYRSLRGQICREVRQNITKRGDAHFGIVTLCRTEIADGIPAWTIEAAN